MRGWFLVLAAMTGAVALSFSINACSSDEAGGGGGITPGDDASTTDGTTTPTDDASTSPDGSTEPTGPIDPAAAARAALIIASCISDDGVNRTLQQLYLQRTKNPFRSSAVVACLATKTNGCAAIGDCIGLRYSPDGGCDAGCSGNVYEECSGASFRLTVDCTKLGEECKPVQGTYCGPSGAQICEEQTAQGSCDGQTPVGCADGVTRRGFDCAAYGATCEQLGVFQTGGTIYGCKGAGGACAGTGSGDPVTLRWEGERCENGKLVGCMSNGLSTLDCAQAGKGFTCFSVADAGQGSTAYCGTASECSPQSVWNKVAATCEGTSVVMCNGGKTEKLDCTSLGFTGCAAGVCTPGMN